MKVQIAFTFDDKKYKYAIDADDVDLGHYDNIWEYWVTESENLEPHGFVDEENGLTFKINGNKVFTEDEKIPLVSGEDICIYIYASPDADDWCQLILPEDIEVLYA